ncbi:hypothetical protein KFE98_15895 [bacterium SCSIO 12741]|nr:hypothetical protein KFE98_15895 [bacterium SCSIO 12741]
MNRFSIKRQRELLKGLCLAGMILMGAESAQAQWVVIDENGGSPDASSALDIRATDKGVLIPRLTTTQMTSISSPATGLMIYNSDSSAFYFYSGSGWVGIRNGSDTLAVIQNPTGANKVEIDNSTIRFEQGGNEKMRVHSNGNVGVGTTNPGSPIHVESAAPVNANTGQIQISESGSDNMTLGRTTSYGYVQSHNLEPLALNPLGNNVGIGTTATDSALTVNGGIHAEYIRLTGGASDGRVLTSSSNGTATWSTPAVTSLGDTTQIADQDNNTKVVTDLGGANDNQVRIYNSGTQYFSFKAGGRFEMLNSGTSVFIGESAGASDDLSSNANTLVGYKAGANLSTGAQNTMVGANSGSSATGNNNSALGYNSLASLTSGTNNTALGWGSMQSLTDGTQNTAIGYSTLQGNSSGDRNVVAGYQSGSAFTGNNGVGIGAQALQTGSGANNVAIGYRALQSFSTGTSNVAIGVNSLRNGAGSNNVAIGDDAGQNNTSGSGNVFIGNQAGRNETGSDKLYIENSNSSTPLILGDFNTDDVTIYGNVNVNEDLWIPNGSVGIGTNVPSKQLEIASLVSASASDGAFIDVHNLSGTANTLSGIRFKSNATTGDERHNAAIFHRYVTTSDYQMNFAVQINTTANVDTNDIKMTINDGGHVGIGTTKPTSALHIAVDGGPQLLVSPNSSTSNDGSLTIRGARNTSTSNAQAKLNFENYDNDLGSSNKLGRITGEVTNASTNVGDLVFYSYVDGSTANEAMRIEHDGQVGINTTNPTTDLDVNGDIEADNIKLTSGAGNGKVLVSDADGDASWTDAENISGQKRSIIIPVGNLSDDANKSGVTFATHGTWKSRYAEFADGGTRDLVVTFATPSDFPGGTLTCRIQYSSDATSGNFAGNVAVRGVDVGEVINSNPGGGSFVTAAPATADYLAEVSVTTNSIAAGDHLVYVVIRRSGGSGSDTCTGDFRIFGIAFDYTN